MTNGASTLATMFTALLRKPLIINGAGEGNRTLVIVTKADSCGNLTDRL